MVKRTPPVYHHPPRKTTEHWPRSLFRHRLGSIIDGGLFLCAAVATFVLAWLLIRQGLRFSWWVFLHLLLVWAVTANLALPRLHLVLTSLYVPNYFIGRSRTGSGLLGDPINLALDGDEADIHAAMREAGWTLADPVNLRSSLGIVFSTITGRSYPEAPVSSLYLFGCKQDFAYQMEVEGSPTRRHHVRFWRCPQGWRLPGGEQVGWLAAGTYDRAIGLSLFTLQFTHKIDENIDVERDFIVDSVLFANQEAQLRVIENFSTGYHCRNGGGDVVLTDGNLPVLDVSAVDSELEPASSGADNYALSQRPASAIAGVLLSVILLILNVADIIGLASYGVFHAQGSLSELPSSPTLKAVLLVLESLLTVLNAILVWYTFVGQAWARRVLVFGVTAGVFFDLFSISATAKGVMFPPALMETAVGVLLIYALTGPGVRDWSRALRERQGKARPRVEGSQGPGGEPEADC